MTKSYFQGGCYNSAAVGDQQRSADACTARAPIRAAEFGADQQATQAAVKRATRSAAVWMPIAKARARRIHDAAGEGRCQREEKKCPDPALHGMFLSVARDL